jgi:hypothetical protein
LKQPGGADQYEEVKISWIRGTDPTLFVYDEHGGVIKKIKLAKYDFAQLHVLFSANFKRRESQRSLHTIDNPMHSAALRHDAAGANPSVLGEPVAELAGPGRGSSTLFKPVLLGGIGALAALAIFAITRAIGRHDSPSQDKLCGRDAAPGDPRDV